MNSKDDYLNAIYALLPTGVAWKNTDPQCLTKDFLNSVASELTNTEYKALGMLGELVPSQAVYTLDVWLKEWGIPDDCMTALGQIDFPQDKLQQALSAKVASWGLGFKDAVQAIALRFNYMVDVGRFKPFLVTSTTNERLYDYKWQNSALIITNDSRLQTESFTTIWTVDQPLARWGDRVFECLIRKVVPAHLKPIFSYI